MQSVMVRGKMKVYIKEQKKMEEKENFSLCMVIYSSDKIVCE